MENLIALIELLQLAKVLPFIMAVLLVWAGYLLAKLTNAALSRLLAGKVSAHNSAIARRVGYYSILALFSVSALNQLGFDLSILLGAAGILTVALGFASQTSASNLISGLFLMIEKPFEIKDVIRVANTTGEVISIDLLSVKLRTFDNLFVRIPNETMIKSEVTTLTRYDIRRIELPLGVAYKEDLNLVRQLLLDIIASDPRCMDEPVPQVNFEAFGTSSIDLKILVWARRENRVEVINYLITTIKQRFDEQKIEIPFPHVSLFSGSTTEAFPISTQLGSELKGKS